MQVHAERVVKGPFYATSSDWAALAVLTADLHPKQQVTTLR